MIVLTFGGGETWLWVRMPIAVWTIGACLSLWTGALVGWAIVDVIRRAVR